MPYLVTVNLLWAFSFSLIGEYLAGRVDSIDLYAVVFREIKERLEIRPEIEDPVLL